jgi:hypothetical protein
VRKPVTRLGKFFRQGMIMHWVRIITIDLIEKFILKVELRVFARDWE